MPATNSTSERSFSALRRIQTYLRAMSQELLNYLMLLHVHKERTDTLDIKTILNDFIMNSDHRSSILRIINFSFSFILIIIILINLNFLNNLTNNIDLDTGLEMVDYV